MNVIKMLKGWRGVTAKRPRGKFNQAAASARLGVNLRTYQQWECGRRAPRGLALTALAERIGGGRQKEEGRMQKGERIK